MSNFKIYIMKTRFTFLALIFLGLTTNIFAQRAGYNCTDGVYRDNCEHSTEMYISERPTDLILNTIPAKSGGTGTADDPYIITTAEEFNEMATRLSEGTETQSSTFPNANVGYAGNYFKLANDIELTEFHQVGNYDHIFFGNFDGDNHSISGINGYIEECAGLFNRIGDGGYVCNLSIHGVMEGSIYVGGLVGALMTGSRVSNIHNYVEVRSEWYYAGGIAGSSWGSILGCTNNANISGASDFVGGLVGDCYFDVYDCVNTGDVTGAGSVGGIIGYSFPHNVARCVNAGNLYGDYYSGGVIGFVDNYNYPDLICSELVNLGEVITGDASVIGRLWVEGDVEGHADNCFYNTQNSTKPGYIPGNHEDWVQPKTVLEMIGSGLAESLTSWTFNEGLFPMPAPVAESEIAICAATPAYFFNEDGNVNMYNALNKDFTVNIENGAAWSTDSDIITIEEGVVTLVNTGDCILTLNIGNASKYYNLTVSQPDNVNEIATLSNNIYPNPANNSITIDNQDVKNVKIYNVKGQCMIDVNMNGSSTIDVSALEVGFYILRAEYNDNSIATSNISITR
ncbi:MAG: T9SS type A sorting domain-containing protein [Lentimicrobiaceae bacterium]|nr:T9SS type A sorting domain-containing protein [Lentimicrobiaceae bacterium]